MAKDRPFVAVEYVEYDARPGYEVMRAGESADAWDWDYEGWICYAENKEQAVRVARVFNAHEPMVEVLERLVAIFADDYGPHLDGSCDCEDCGSGPAWWEMIGSEKELQRIIDGGWKMYREAAAVLARVKAQEAKATAAPRATTR
jgi:hypothetical protein